MALSHRFKAVLVLLCLLAFLSSQGTASLSPEHSDDHDTHCCSVCHIGHSLLLAPATVLTFSPTVQLDWHRILEAPAFERKPIGVVRSSRGPPSA